MSEEKNLKDLVNSFLILVLLSFGTIAKANEYLKGFIYAGGGYAHINGLAQTPKGGSPGTTSFLRPSFDEVNIRHEAIIDVAGGLKYNDYFVFIDYKKLHPKGNTTLTSDLITHARFIPIGSEFAMAVHYDWTQLSLGKDFDFQNQPLQISPLFTANWIHYAYDFWATTAQSARHFSVMALSAGLKMHYYFYPHFFMDALFELTLPINEVKIFNGTVGLNRLFTLSAHFTLIPRIGVSGFRLDYEDNQTVPNHIRYTAHPYIVLGITALFC